MGDQVGGKVGPEQHRPWVAVLRRPDPGQPVIEVGVFPPEGHGLAELLVAGRLAAAQVVVIHGGKIVMHQRIGVDHLHRAGGRPWSSGTVRIAGLGGQHFQRFGGEQAFEHEGTPGAHFAACRRQRKYTGNPERTIRKLGQLYTGLTKSSASMMTAAKIRPAAVKVGIRLLKGQRFGFHNFRHSLATFLVNQGTDVKTIQGLLRHAKVTTTLDLYSQSIDASKLNAQKEMALAITSTAVAG